MTPIRRCADWKAWAGIWTLRPALHRRRRRAPPCRLVSPRFGAVSCYRNAEGLTWDGQGEMRSWLKRAVNAGQSVEFFRVG
ncbi:H-NS family nucleoid-associated regulatory protein [Cupriavidus yeoncheonensis]|uniref:H-NS family nucleoid-associated regulatory protein n=1 Tax=Cupriavidus yeoncheonensis TaxID=1462994 RepID=UPI003B847B85